MRVSIPAGRPVHRHPIEVAAAVEAGLTQHGHVGDRADVGRIHVRLRRRGINPVGRFQNQRSGLDQGAAQASFAYSRKWAGGAPRPSPVRSASARPLPALGAAPSEGARKSDVLVTRGVGGVVSRPGGMWPSAGSSGDRWRGLAVARERHRLCTAGPATGTVVFHSSGLTRPLGSAGHPRDCPSRRSWRSASDVLELLSLLSLNPGPSPQPRRGIGFGVPRGT